MDKSGCAGEQRGMRRGWPTGQLWQTMAGAGCGGVLVLEGAYVEGWDGVDGGDKSYNRCGSQACWQEVRGVGKGGRLRGGGWARSGSGGKGGKIE